MNAGAELAVPWNATATGGGKAGERVDCPLCGSTANTLRETIGVDDITGLYSRQFGIDVAQLFSGVRSLDFLECDGCGLGHYHPPITGDGGFYDRLQGAPWYYQRAKYEYEFVANLIAPKARVLDVGSGEGAFSRHLPRNADYTGLDLSEEARRKARANGIRVISEPVEAHAEANSGRYDAVVSFQSLEHVSRPQAFAAAAARCVGDSGMFAVAVPSEDSFLRFASNSPLNMPPHHVTRWTDRALHRLGAILGMRLSILHHEPLQEIHREWAMAVMANAMLGRGRRQIEFHSGMSDRISRRAASALGRWLKHRLHAELQPSGHTVIAVYSR